ncbi:hypothetical protein N9N99_03685 [Gammaproteobacteria bacterium]|nr:hypothetical protein [Gammaproteobacteria bacterium]
MSNKSNPVISFIHPKKFGLIDIANALTEYGHINDKTRVYSSISNFKDLLKTLITNKNHKKTICIFWDNSLYSLNAMLVCAFFRVKILYYLHEPGGIGQKLYKGDPFIYSIKASIAEWLMKLISSKILVARADKLAFGDYYAPLLYSQNRPYAKHNSKTIGFLGAKRDHRMHHVFERISSKLTESGYKIIYFPSSVYGKDIKDKVKFMEECCAIWNCYGVPYNQSGVTGDCIASGVPCIVSKYEPFINDLENLDLSVKIDIRLSDDDLALQLIDILEKRMKAKIYFNNSKKELASIYGGELAFRKHWLKIFNSL